MLGLITDRTQRNVYRRKELLSKGWTGMTIEEKAEWEGNPLTAIGTNLFSCGTNYSSSVELKYRNKEIIATAKVAGSYLYAISIIGKAADYNNKIFTLSAEFTAPAKIEMFWHDGNGIDWAGGTLLATGSALVDTITYPNVNNREYLAAYLYVTQDAVVEAGKTITFGKVMLENGITKHEYVPYTEILATDATKGAYNYSDLNRVERAVEEISDRAGLNLITKTNWIMWDLPTETDMNRYLSNVTVIKEHFGINISLPTSMNNFTYEYANNIEMVLDRAYESLTK